ncbi:MAG: response regulator transcription factor [Cyclobacteriaceae bacterium]|jgi:two-component system, OmpR family, copper resistance phosphate regulon response regulator CusR|nr:response regulator transcription factor [Cyclobacteriaceae bacterium]
MKKILLVEDETSVAAFIKKGLSEEGYEVSIALDGKTGLQMALANSFDLIILDIMLPEVNGLEVCRTIRLQNKSVAILFLTALGTSENVVVGLGAEADDYLIKPFKFIELLARVKSLLRRADQVLPVKLEEEVFTIGDLVVNNYSKTVKRGERLISLTSTEYRLLLLFIRNQKKVLSRVEILEEVWGINFDMATNVVDVYVNYLRKKIEKEGIPKLIHTVIGMGYVLKQSDEDSN